MNAVSFASHDSLYGRFNVKPFDNQRPIGPIESDQCNYRLRSIILLKANHEKIPYYCMLDSVVCCSVERLFFDNRE